ncbi:MAG TPA: hypothetical protein VLB73_01645 [Patescibacteria group bacterium]|nr:hypothetical protein [Patescibacteria group bacterium]
MSQTVERQKSGRFLRITEKQNHSLGRRASGLLEKVGLEGFEKSENRTPVMVEIPRSNRFAKRLSADESARTAHAIAQHGLPTAQGTSLDLSRWSIEEVRVDAKGQVKQRKIPRSWKRKVRAAHMFEVSSSQARQNSTVHLDGMSRFLKKTPIREALRRESQEADRLKRADKSTVVSGWMGWRAKFVGLLAEGNPVRAANRYLKVGQSRHDAYGQIHTMMLQVADAQLDPADRIHGPFEQGVKLLQRFQRGVGGAAVSSLLGDVKGILKLSDSLVTLNKFASRDARAELSLGGVLRVARRLFVIDRYGRFYGKRGMMSRLVLFPADSLGELAADRRMQRGNVAKLAKTEAILTAHFAEDSLEGMHQRMVAQEFIAAYNAPAPRLEFFTELGYDKVNELTHAVEDGAQHVAEKIQHPLRRGEATQKVKETKQGVVEQAASAYGDTPVSVAKQVEAILEHADTVLASGNLTPIERVRWTIAKDYAERFNRLQQVAQKVGSSQEK